jgi:hypothetical protein
MTRIVDTMPAHAHVASPADPRTFPDARDAPADDAALYALAARSLAAETGQASDAIAAQMQALLSSRLADNGASLARLLAGSPSVDVSRVLWRQLDQAWTDATRGLSGGVALTLFAVPLVIILRSGAGETVVPGIVDDAPSLAAILRAHRALRGNETLALGSALVAADAIDVRRLPDMLAWHRMADEAAVAVCRDLPPAPLACAADHESVHLRFLVGTAVAAPGADLLGGEEVGKWGIPFTRELARQLARPGLDVLALPRAPMRPLAAVQHGRVVQREVTAQVFASNAIRQLRSGVGEPIAVISSHRCPDAPGGGEVRLSLSSPFEPKAAQGLRCPLVALDRVGDVVAMLVGLLRDCRVTDIRVLAGVHPDWVEGTRVPLLYKPETIPSAVTVTLH